MRRILIPLALLGLLLVAGVAGAPILQRHRRAAQLQALGASLDQARAVANSCKTALAFEEDGFLRFDRWVDSLRAEVDGFLDPEQGGVPEALYREYLEAFDLYNRSVEDWQARADSLQALESQCRAFVDAHNELRDSIEAIQESWREPR